MALEVVVSLYLVYVSSCLILVLLGVPTIRAPKRIQMIFYTFELVETS